MHGITITTAAALLILAARFACAERQPVWGQDFQVCIQTLDRVNYNARARCSAGASEIPENSIVTFWSMTQNRTGGVDDWPTLLDQWARAQSSKDLAGLSIYVDAWNTSATAGGGNPDNGKIGVPCTTADYFGLYTMQYCAATSVVVSPAYDGPAAYKQYLIDNPSATSVPIGGAVFLSMERAQDKALAIPAGYVKVVSPHPPPYKALFWAQVVMMLAGNWEYNMTIVAADEKRANLDSTNVTPLNHLVAHTFEWAAGASVSKRGCVPFVLLAALFVLVVLL
ncbi:hypothetical protein BDZ88DRAFT_426269 [Geranomyces variabilis]|nr:hypothetical protein BDZ88DRAFT_426269 [Geranomyces variabilis]KAJ3134081.1 hypothetical protein HDU90_005429 [Geranomyces variabilis]